MRCAASTSCRGGKRQTETPRWSTTERSTSSSWGGPTGVESAGALGELYRNIFVEDYPQLPQEKARITLVEAGPDLFTMFKQDIRDYTRKALEKRGVDLLLGELVASIGPTRVTLKSGKVLDAHTLVWGAGLQGNPIVTSLGLELEKGTAYPSGPI